jgi:hypothetical protein
MATYRFLAHDLRTNSALAELPLSDVTYSEALNGTGDFSATMPLHDSARDLIAATQPERTAVYIERDGATVGGAIIWGRTRSARGPVNLTGAGWWSYFRRQHLRNTLQYTDTDQLTIARELVSAALAQPGGGIGITVGAEASGVLRTRTYQSFELKQIAEAVEQLAACDNGFDFAVDTNQDRTKTLRLGFPRRGRIAGTTGIVFEADKNLMGYDITEDGSRSARTFTAVGAGDGSDMLLSTSTRTDLLDAGFPITSDTEAYKDVIVQATLDAHARADVNARALTPTFWRVTVDPDDVDGGVGAFITGDDVLLQVSNDDNFPRQADGSPGYRRFHRVLAWTLNVPANGKDVLSITLGEAL